MCKNIMRVTSELDIARCASLASLLEVSASPKPGNVHRFSSPKEHDKSYEQFLAGIAAIGPHLHDCARESYHLGKRNDDPYSQLHLGFFMKNALLSMILHQSGGNLLLGHVLLLFPLVSAAAIALAHQKLAIGDLEAILRKVLDSGNPEDVINLYEGIRACNPGGLGNSEKFDINNPEYKYELRGSDANFQMVFEINSDRDLISREWISGFSLTFSESFPRLRDLITQDIPINDAIVQLFLETLSNHPDSLIARKNGVTVARSVSQKASKVLDSGGIFTDRGRKDIKFFDVELATENGRLNPGTTADLCAAAIFLLLLTGFNP